MLDHLFTHLVSAHRHSFEAALLERQAVEERFQVDVFLGDVSFETSYSLPGEERPARIRVDTSLDWPTWSQTAYRSWAIGDDPEEPPEVLVEIAFRVQGLDGVPGAAPLLATLPERFPGARVVRLGENHRCSPQVVTVATAALGLSGEEAPTSTRADGPAPRVRSLATDAEEAAWVARQVWLAHRPGRRWAQIAVLARTNAQLAPLLEALRAERIPARLAGGDLGPASDLRPRAEGRREPDDEADAPPHNGEDPADSDAVVLSTFHRAKGLQWPVVFVVGLSDGLVPLAAARTAAARDEERRLLYVALTRAEDELTCTWAEHRDAASAESGAAGRRPSAWLEEVARASASMTAERPAPEPDEVVAQLVRDAVRRELPVLTVEARTSTRAMQEAADVAQWLQDLDRSDTAAEASRRLVAWLLVRAQPSGSGQVA